VRILRFLFVVLLLPCLLTAAGHSWEDLQQLNQGRRIRVFLLDRGSFTGTFVGCTAESLTLRDRGADRAVPRAQVRKVTTGSRPRRLRNTLIGLGIGAGSGGLVVWKATDASERWGYGIAAAIMVVGGTVIGAVLPANRTVYMK
jgi:hypothetical protein